MALTATIEVPPGQKDAAEFSVRLVLKNTGEAARVINPDLGHPSPEMNWPWPQATYQTAMLVSYHFLVMSVLDERGQETTGETIQTWATPVIKPKIELEPGAALELTIPIGSFYRLASGNSYRVSLEYGDSESRVGAQALVTVP